MLERIAYGTLVIAFLVLLMLCDSLFATHAERVPAIAFLVRQGSVLPLVVVGVSIASALEVVRLFNHAGFNPHRSWSALMAAVLAASPWLCAAGLLGDRPVDEEGLRWQLIWLFVAVGGTAVLQLGRRDTRTAIGDIATTLATVVYAGFLPSFILLLRCDAGYPATIGPWLILVYLAVTKSSDIGAYFLGSWLGRHKLIPWVSPGKSVEGMFGGIAASVAIMLLILAVCEWCGHIDQEKIVGRFADIRLAAVSLATDIHHALRGLSRLQTIVFAVLMSAVGQIGDLLESLFKRSAGAKDSARILPGFGGVLDMVDSVFLTAPVAWLMLTWR